MCSIPGCSRPVIARGMCHAHYQRWQKHGNPGTSLIAAKAADGEPLRYLLAHAHDGCCYPWPYATDDGGYPKLTDEGQNRYGHRVVCEMINGPPRDGEEVRHLCGKGHLGCFNADCLEWGLHVENEYDKVAHGTRPHGESHGRMMLPTREITRLRKMDATGKYTRADLAKRFGISRQQVWKIVSFRQRKNG